MESLLGARNGVLLGEALRASTRSAIACRTAFADGADQTSSDCRPAMALAVGERGRSFGQFNGLWAWVGETLSDMSDALPADAETIWEEGA